MIKKWNSVTFNFIWKNKTHDIEKSQIIKDYNNGGLRATEFESMTRVFKLNWIKAYLAQPVSIYNQNVYSRKLEGWNFLLRYDLEVFKLPIKLSDFHKLILYCFIYP